MVFCAFFNAFLPFFTPSPPVLQSPRRCTAKPAPSAPQRLRRCTAKKQNAKPRPETKVSRYHSAYHLKKVITQRLSTAMPCPAAAGNRAGRRRALRPLTHRTLSEKRFTQAVVTVIAALFQCFYLLYPHAARLSTDCAPLSRRSRRPRAYPADIPAHAPKSVSRKSPGGSFRAQARCFHTGIQRYLPVILFLLFFISCGVPLATIRPPAFPPPGPISMI